MSTTGSPDDDNNVVYWALNGYGVTLTEILINGAIFFLATVIAVLNALVLDTMIRIKEPTEPTDIMMCSLAVADLANGLFMLYQASYNLAYYQIYLECLIRHGINFGLVTTMVLHLTCLTWDRYIKIMFPYRYNEMCKNRTVAILSALLWALSIMVAIIPSLGVNMKEMSTNGQLYTMTQNKDLPVCSFFGKLHPDFASFLVTLFMVSYVIMGILYLHIFKVANRHARLIEVQTNHKVATGHKNSHSWRYTKTVLIILGLYFFCWLPAGTVLIMFVRGDLRYKTVVEQGNIIMYAGVTAFLNSLINPIIYAFKISAVRTRFLKLFYCKSCKSLSDHSTTTVTGAHVSVVSELHSCTNNAYKVDFA